MVSEHEPRHDIDGSKREFERRRDDQDRTLVAIHRVEAALESAAPGRERPWRDELLAALRVLDDSTATEEANAARPDSLVSDIARIHPRLRSRVHGLRAQYRHVRESIASLRRDLEEPDDAVPDFADLRHRLSWLITALRHQRARESDLVYEAYYQTYNVDIDINTESRPLSARP